jgi:hypothetical protein
VPGENTEDGHAAQSIERGPMPEPPCLPRMHSVMVPGILISLCPNGKLWRPLYDGEEVRQRTSSTLTASPQVWSMARAQAVLARWW